jgi:hypothetical protein
LKLFLSFFFCFTLSDLAFLFQSLSPLLSTLFFVWSSFLSVYPFSLVLSTLHLTFSQSLYSCLSSIRQNLLCDSDKIKVRRNYFSQGSPGNTKKIKGFFFCVITFPNGRYFQIGTNVSTLLNIELDWRHVKSYEMYLWSFHWKLFLRGLTRFYLLVLIHLWKIQFIKIDCANIKISRVTFLLQKHKIERKKIVDIPLESLDHL